MDREMNTRDPPSARNKIKTAVLLWITMGIYYFISVIQRNSIENCRNVEERAISIQKRNFVLQNDEFTPEIVWLMSFPNSGTSYTMSMVARASNRSFATNYADEVTPKDAPHSLSIYPRRPEGPYWAGMSGRMLTARVLPDKYVITKTHCGSRCMKCGPQDYVETAQEFLRDCATGRTRDFDGRGHTVEYPPERVSKAIHLIRNPMNNAISRFHLHYHHQVEENDTEWLRTHPNNATGFHAWCRDLDSESHEQDLDFFGDILPKAPCYGELYKYTQWHNLVPSALDLIDHPVPVLTLYYEDYAHSFNQTTTTLLSFLELDLEGPIRDYTSKTKYEDYFTHNQLKDIKSLIQNASSNITWGKIHRYFEGL